MPFSLLMPASSPAAFSPPYQHPPPDSSPHTIAAQKPQKTLGTLPRKTTCPEFPTRTQSLLLPRFLRYSPPVRVPPSAPLPPVISSGRKQADPGQEFGHLGSTLRLWICPSLFFLCGGGPSFAPGSNAREFWPNPKDQFVPCLAILVKANRVCGGSATRKPRLWVNRGNGPKDFRRVFEIAGPPPVPSVKLLSQVFFEPPSRRS